jgi:cardiolipin synthase
MHSKKVRMSKFHHFESLGGEVEAFFASKFPLINFRSGNLDAKKASTSPPNDSK